jgi:N-methylhydantoinase B/oxoprolinase/acetone carboxylase alpha subunit
MLFLIVLQVFGYLFWLILVVVINTWIQSLIEEGAAIIAFKLVRNGVFQEEGISDLLRAPGKLEGNFGTRNLGDNISDLKAQVAANQKGAKLMHELVRVCQVYHTYC